MINRCYLFFLSLCFCVGLSAQQDPLVVDFEATSTPTSGGTYDVDVRVSDFDQLLGAQFIVTWDSTVLEIDTLPFITTDLADFNQGAISLPSQTASMTRGRLRVSWFSFSFIPQTLPDDHLLFSMRFNVVGQECDTTTIRLTELPDVLIEISDQNFENIGATWTSLPVMVQGTGCGIVDPPSGDEIQLIFPDITANPGENICIPFTTNNFDSIETFQGSIMWDPNVLSYTGVQSFSLPGMSPGNFNTSTTDMGVTSFVWFDATGVTPATIPDGGTIFEICFDVVGADGTSTAVKAFDGNTSIQISSPAPTGIRDFSVVEGSVSVGMGNGGGNFGIIAEEACANLVDGEICVDFSTQNFNDISGMQYNIEWDPTVLAYNRVEVGSISEFAFTFNPVGNDKLRYSWTTQAGVGVTIPDATVIYSVCFDLVGDCDDVTDISFVSDNVLQIEASDGNFNPIPANQIELIDGSVEIKCGIVLDATISDVRCNGDLNGSINLNISGGQPDFNINWMLPGGGSSSNELLVGQGAGTYNVTVTDQVGTTATGSFVINEPNAIIIDVTTTPATSMTGGGTIAASITGGDGNYTTQISPNVDINDAAPGTYTILVTDGQGCQETQIFTVGMSGGCNLDVSTVIFSAVCGDDGRIQVSVTGGSGDYSITSSPSLSFDSNNSQFINVPEGNYTITIVDNNDTSCSATESVTVLTSTPQTLNAQIINIIAADCQGQGGSFDVDITGGCTPYNITIRELPNGSAQVYNENNTYPAGDYEVVVTDNAGESVVLSATIPMETGGGGSLAVSQPQVSDAVCAGTNGSATFTVTGGCGEISCSVMINNGAAQDCDLITNSNGSLTGSFPIGTHTITFTDDFGDSASTSFTIGTSADGIVITVNSSISGSGVIDISVTNGTMPYTYVWTGPSGNIISGQQDLSNLTVAGTYTVDVEDTNGCTASLEIPYSLTDDDVILVLNSVETPFDGFATPCAVGECMGAVSGMISGGSAPYTVTFTDENLEVSTFEFNSEGSIDIMGLCAGSYDVEITDGSSTFNVQSTVIISAPSPILIVEDEKVCPDPGLNNGSISTLVSGGVGGYIYTWNPETTAPIPGPSNEDLGLGIYTLTVQDNNGCEAQLTIDLLNSCNEANGCFEGRRVITPNGDGSNDFFIISCAENAGYALSIFDRWSRLVFESSNYMNNWDGFDMDNESLPEGAYYWVLRANNQTIKGTVTLLRD